MAHGKARPSRHKYWLLALHAALFLVGLTVRLIGLMDAPPITDEVEGMWLAHDVARGRVLPVVDYPSTYYGSFYIYLLAGFYLVVGSSFDAARLLTAIFGALTPIAVFWLASVAAPHVGARMDRFSASFLAALLMLTSATHVAIDSHIFWPTSFAPLLMALLLGTYIKGLQPGYERWLIATGVLAALLLQATPHIVAAFPGLLAHYIADGKRRARLLRHLADPWPYLAAAVFFLVYSPVILYNLLSGGGSLQSATQYTGSYAFELVNGPGDYLRNIRELATALVRVVGGNLTTVIPAWEYFQLATSGLLLLASGWWCWKRGLRSPVFLVASTALLMPIYNKGYYAGYPIQNRYLATLLPAIYCMIALFVFGALLVWAERMGTRLMAQRGSLMARSGLALVLVLLVLTPVFSTLNYYRLVEERTLTNRELIRMFEELERSRPPSEVVALDPDWLKTNVGPGTTLLMTAQIWMELRGRQYSPVRQRKGR